MHNSDRLGTNEPQLTTGEGIDFTNGRYRLAPRHRRNGNHGIFDNSRWSTTRLRTPCAWSSWNTLL